MSLASISVATAQCRAIYNNVKQSLSVIHKIIQWAEKEEIDIVCFPECFLQGYILDKIEARKASYDLNSKEFKKILKFIHSDKTTIILGLIEREENNIFNTAVVIKRGKLIGKYRKTHLLKKEKFFKCGSNYPVFEKKRIKYGINICYDLRFPEPAKRLAKKGVNIIFCPLNNSLPHKVANKWKNRHIKYWMNRAKETSCWLVTADVVENSDTNTGYGFTTLINPNGKIIKSLRHLKPGKLKHQMKFNREGNYY